MVLLGAFGDPLECIDASNPYVASLGAELLNSSNKTVCQLPLAVKSKCSSGEVQPADYENAG